MTDPAIFKDDPWDALDPALLAQAAKVPTMLAPEEQRFYFWATSEWMQDKGAVVDLGCFVGGSTARLAAGHQLAGHTGLIHAYDRFGANEAAKEHILYAQGVAPFEGSKTLDLAIDLLTPWTERIALHPGQIEEQIWDEGPIEILVMDASKSVQTMDAMTRTFFPSLIPGQSLVVQQDYLFWRLPWIAMQMELLADYFTPVASVPGHTMVFLNTKQIDDDALNIGMVTPRTHEQRLDLLERAKQRLTAAGFDVTKPMAEQFWTLQKHPNTDRAGHFTQKCEVEPAQIARP
ncbi:hypothetical protein [Aliiroseovarius marinus]|uniref:hypothetical protein n=1 Tax=Aliiroseovarius marinus TaxID=2500159 RepID=UPI00105BF868|nr:hypothetical protein [Aliiroseovarius marinus]